MLNTKVTFGLTPKTATIY